MKQYNLTAVDTLFKSITLINYYFLYLLRYKIQSYDFFSLSCEFLHIISTNFHFVAE